MAPFSVGVNSFLVPLRDVAAHQSWSGFTSGSTVATGAATTGPVVNGGVFTGGSGAHAAEPGSWAAIDERTAAA